ncbi:MAG: hypothetical protein IT431_12895 [Phycisphaerales bacterium]|nr:hypothetical protein [Phycisphaerales bacterium]
MRRHSFSMILSMLCAILSIVIAPAAAPGQNCGQPPGATLINDLYQPDPVSGTWWRITNWDDTNGNKLINTHTDPAQSDFFNFTDSAGTMLQLPGPTAMQLTGPDGQTWYYFIGAQVEPDIGNYRIYRTQNFSDFDLFMKAFDPHGETLYQNSQWISNGVLHLNGNTYKSLLAPQLFIDPTATPGDSRWIYLSFTAAQDSPSGDGIGDSSVFLVRMKQSEFLAWAAQPDKQGDVDMRRFADVRSGVGYQQWYYYKLSNGPVGPYLYDGGWAAGHPVACSGSPYSLLGPNCGQLRTRLSGWAHRCVGAAYFMRRDGFEFFDPWLSNGDPWKRVMLYTWEDANDDVAHQNWGIHISAHPLLSNNIQFDRNHTTVSIAFDRNTNNKLLINGAWLDNGMVAINTQTQGLQERYWGGVAEGPSAIYLPETDRYYVFYSRNAYNAASYQIVYRMTAPGAPFSSIAMTWGDPNVSEYLLLRTHDFTTYRDANPGTGKAFVITDAGGTDHAYLAMGFKLDRNAGAMTDARTLFIKELTVADAQTGLLVQLQESTRVGLNLKPISQLTATEARADMRIFRIPKCRQ